MQDEAENRAEKPRETRNDPCGDGDEAIALRSKLARKIAVHHN